VAFIDEVLYGVNTVLGKTCGKRKGSDRLNIIVCYYS
jgi:hypothetical protein